MSVKENTRSENLCEGSGKGKIEPCYTTAESNNKRNNAPLNCYLQIPFVKIFESINSSMGK